MPPPCFDEADRPLHTIRVEQAGGLLLDAVDFRAPGFFADPYRTYADLRANAPIFYDERSRRWFVTRYADVDASLRDPYWRKGGNLAVLLQARSPQMQQELGPFVQTGAKHILSLDPPEHTRLRRLASQAFTSRMVELLRPRIERIVHDLLDQLPPTGPVDLLAAFAYPLPAIVIAEMLGIPPADRAAFREWADGPLSFFGNVQANAEEDQRVARGYAALVAYFDETARRLQAHPQDDLLNALLLTEAEGDRLSREEWLATAMLLMGAGHETTTGLIGNGTYALLRHAS